MGSEEEKYMSFAVCSPDISLGVHHPSSVLSVTWFHPAFWLCDQDMKQANP